MMKNTLSRLLALVLCLCLVIPFAGCGNSEEPTQQPESSDVSTTATYTDYAENTTYSESGEVTEDTLSTEDTGYTGATDGTWYTAATTLPVDTQPTYSESVPVATTSTAGKPGATTSATQSAKTTSTAKATNGTTKATSAPTYTVPTYTYPSYTAPTYTAPTYTVPTSTGTQTIGATKTAATTKGTTIAATQATTVATTQAATQAVTTTGAHATTQAVTTTQGKKPVVTFTTTTEWTTTTKDKSSGKAIKVLAIGNSFSVDAMHNHLFDIFESAGYTDITLGNLYIGGCSLDTHYANLKSNTPAYTFYLNTDNEWTKREGVSAATGLASNKWDVVTIQQVSSESGRPQTYSHLQSILDMVKAKAPQAKILWHMTWAYQQNSDHWAFVYHNKDQMTMYNDIISTVQEQVLTKSAIKGIIPAGTAIQNLRTSDLGDTLTIDGHHLRDTYGDYTAALTWFCAITGASTDAVTYCPGNISDYGAEMAQSVTNALKNPFAVTPCN